MIRGLTMVSLVLVACDCSPPTGGADPDGVEGSEQPSQSTAAVAPAPCGRVALDVSEEELLPWDEPVEPTRAMWLGLSLTTADAVVVGRAEGDRWHVEEVLCGALPPSPPLVELGGEVAELAVRFLVRTQRGYFDTGPNQPATVAEWEALDARAVPREQRELEFEETEFEVARYAMVDGRRERHGVSAAAGDDYVAVTLADGTGEELANQVFLTEGRLRVWKQKPVRGRGFYTRWWDDESARDSEHFLDRRIHGTEQSWDREGTLERSTSYRQGVRHGSSRILDEDGAVLVDAVFEEGLIPPITEPATMASDAVLHVGRGTSYEAPPELVERITVGMTPQEVADLLGLRVSAELGVHFPGEPCGRAGVHVHFAGGRVSELETTYPMGGCTGL